MNKNGKKHFSPKKTEMDKYIERMLSTKPKIDRPHKKVKRVLTKKQENFVNRRKIKFFETTEKSRNKTSQKCVGFQQNIH